MKLRCARPALKLSVIFMLATLFVFFQTRSASTQSVSVVNGGFETGDFTGWTVITDDGFDPPNVWKWYAYSGNKSPFNRDITPPPQGTFAAVTDSFGGSSSILYQDITLTPGPHTLTFLLYYINRAPGG